MNTRVLQKRLGCHGVIGGKEVVIFSSNDYLGLSSHPEVIEAAINAAEKYGIGTGGAPGTTGTTDLHQKLSRAIAAFKTRDKAVLLPSGYQANIAIHHTLSSKEAVFHIDKRHHPSAIDGARIDRGSRLFRFDHDNLNDLEENLKSNQGKTNIVSVPSVFTVDGDIASLDKIADLKKKYDFILILDEAHATGCVGKSGRGLEEHFDLHGIADFIMGSFSKALGSQGGFVAYNRAAEKFLQSGFRQFVYSTSLSTISVAAALKALDILKTRPGLYKSLQDRKLRIIEQFRKTGVDLVVHDSMILLTPCDEIKSVVHKLLDEGFVAIPTETYIGNDKRDCLRITPMVSHTDEEIAKFADSLRKIMVQQNNSTNNQV